MASHQLALALVVATRLERACHPHPSALLQMPLAVRAPAFPLLFFMQHGWRFFGHNGQLLRCCYSADHLVT